MKQWKKTVIACSLATGLVLGNVVPGIVSHSFAAPRAKIQVVQVKHQTQVQNIKKLAVAGKTVNSECFSIGSKVSHIKQKWGKPDAGSDNSYLTYGKRHITFEAVGGKVTKIQSTDKSYWNITYKEVRKGLGTPINEVKGEDGVYLTFKAGKHTLDIAFYYNNEGNAPSTIKDVTVH